MQLTNQQLLRFVGRIKLPRDKKSACSGQIAALEKNVKSAIRDVPEARVVGYKLAGSWEKGTSLKPWGDSPVDVDMVFFVDVEKPSEFNAERLRRKIIASLREDYPQKDPGDFSNRDKTVWLVFHGTGLEVDIVPFFREKSNPYYGRQPRKKLHSEVFRTSVEGQLQFICAVKDRWRHFTAAVRMVKWWKNRQELALPSFAVELLFAYLFSRGRIGDNIEHALIEFFEFVSANPQMRVNFAGAIGDMPFGSPVIADPTNNENNVVEKVNSSEWKEIVSGACKAFETLSYAQAVSGKSETDDLWREVFDHFNTKEG